MCKTHLISYAEKFTIYVELSENMFISVFFSQNNLMIIFYSSWATHNVQIWICQIVFFFVFVFSWRDLSFMLDFLVQ